MDVKKSKYKLVDAKVFPSETSKTSWFAASLNRFWIRVLIESYVKQNRFRL